MLLVIGLGNIGNEYTNNRHNVGFLAIDYILKQINHQVIKKNSFLGSVYKTPDVLFLKPSTFMNLSGQSLMQVASFYKINPEDIFVIYDDLDMKFGALKFRIGGRDAGHNGLKSINGYIKNTYKKIKVGIGRPEYKSQVNSYVLGDFEDTQLEFLNKNIFPNIKNAIDDASVKTFTQISSQNSLS
jgi:PTH1 family peptidyl-tRNA hydrolase